MRSPGETAGCCQNDIAIVGLACRFGGDASNEHRLWQLLCDGRSASEPDTSGRGGGDSWPRYRLRQDHYVFDADFFGISHREARAMDPNHRMLLEVTYEALEQAGLTLDAVAGSNTSCYVGQFTADYAHMLSRDIHGAPTHTATGSNSAISASRLSWFFDFKGPSHTLNTACSSGLVALHAAYESIRREGASMAVAASSNLILTSDMTTALEELNFLSPDGKCKTFDSSANGYARGEGVTSLILRPVQAAIDAGAPIRAIIRGSGINHNGHGERPGITVPSVSAQSSLITQTYQKAGLDYLDTHYVEAHGTGTKVGDPIEMEAIGTTLGQGRAIPLLVGSSKPNLGHTEASAGLAGIIKGVQILENGSIPPNILLVHPNPDIDFARWNLRVPQQFMPWPKPGLRRLSVCSTGYGGVNGHVILEDAEHYIQALDSDKAITVRHLAFPSPVSPTPIPHDSATLPDRLFALHAHDRDGLDRQRASLENWFIKVLNRGPGDTKLLRDLAYTLNHKRSPLPWGSSIVASSLTELRNELSLSDVVTLRAQQSLPSKPRLCYVFTGQSAQWPLMGTHLYQQSTIFRESLDQADRHLKALQCPWSVVEELHRPKAHSQVHEPEFSQALCTVLQVGLVDLFEQWHLRPDYMAGHSSGEIAAAYCFGALTKEAAWEIAYYRGQLAASLDTRKSTKHSAGAMLAVGVSSAEAQQTIDQIDLSGRTVVACRNAPQNVTLSGDECAIDQLEKYFTEKGAFARRLKVSVAYHSPHMERIAANYFRAMRRIRPSRGRNDRMMFSTVTGKVIQPAELGPRYFVDNLLSPVKFVDAVEAILEHEQTESRTPSSTVFVEIGPHSALKGPIGQIVSVGEQDKPLYFPAMLRGEKSTKSALHVAGSLHALGVPIDLNAVNDEDCEAQSMISPRIVADLPPYQWNHSTPFSGLTRWMKEHGERAYSFGALLGARIPSLTQGQHLWRRYINTSKWPWLNEHRIDGVVLYPAAAHLVAVLEAASAVADQNERLESITMREVVFHAPIIIPQEKNIEMCFELRDQHASSRERARATWAAFTASSCCDGTVMQVNCTGFVMLNYKAAAGSPVDQERANHRRRMQEAQQAAALKCREDESHESFYTRLHDISISYGPCFQMLSEIQRGPTISSFRVQSQTWKGENHGIIHPGTLDSMLHSVFSACNHRDISLTGPMVPALIEELEITNSLLKHGTQREHTGFATVERRGFLDLVGGFTAFDSTSQDLSVHVRGVRMQRTGTHSTPVHPEEAARKICTSLTWQRFEVNTNQGDAQRTYSVTSVPGILLADLASEVQASLVRAGHECVERGWPLDTKTVPRSERCIFLTDFDESELLDGEDETFERLQRVLSQLSDVLWVSVDNPSGSIVPGLGRPLRHEMPSLSLRTLQFTTASLKNPVDLAAVVVQLACANTSDVEFRENAGELQVSRLTYDPALDTRMMAMKRDSESLVDRLPVNFDHPVLLAIKQPGDLSSLCFSLDKDDHSQKLQADEVEIEVRATGLNFRDVMVAIGAMADQLLGFDASGTVTAVGPGVDDLTVGDRVCTLFQGAHRSRIRSPRQLVQRIPVSMSFESASTLPLVLVTAYNALVRVAGAQAGQTVLIHAGAGGVGQAAIQLAQHLELNIIVTVSSDAKRKHLQDRFGLRDDHILSSRDLSFVAAIRRLTCGRGCDIILNQLAGEFQRQSWGCIAPGGFFIELGFKDIQNNGSLDMLPFAQDATFSFFNVARMLKASPGLVGDILDQCFSLVHGGILQPSEPLNTFSIDAVTEAFRMIQGGKHMGKTALVWANEPPLPIRLPSKDVTRLPPDATYLLVGGLGGVGTGVARLLADMGARHLCFLSRSSQATGDGQVLLNELRDRGVQVSRYAADVADTDSLSTALKHCQKEHPPIRGVLQMAMVLRDGLFENMSAAHWRESLRPKVQGSRNLDQAVGSVDFFIMLSSVAGIFGNPTQSNYAAGCAYQDALAHERRARGCPCSVSIDLGIMRGVGYFASEERATGYLKQWENPFGMDEDELHAVLRLAIGGETRAQVITGLPTPAAAGKAGTERPFFLDESKYARLAESASSDAGPGDDRTARSQGPQHTLSQATSSEEVKQLVTETLVQRVATSLQIDQSAVQLSLPLHSYGVDSLVAVEIRAWIAQQLKTDISTLELTGNASLGSLVSRIISTSPLIPTELRG